MYVIGFQEQSRMVDLLTGHKCAVLLTGVAWRFTGHTKNSVINSRFLPLFYYICIVSFIFLYEYTPIPNIPTVWVERAKNEASQSSLIFDQCVFYSSLKLHLCYWYLHPWIFFRLLREDPAFHRSRTTD